MQIDAFVQMLSVIPKDKDRAMTRTEICTKYYEAFADDKARPIRKASRQKNVDRWVANMWNMGLLRSKSNDYGVKNCRFYLSEDKVLTYLLNGSVALRLMWARKLLDPFRRIDGEDPVNGFASNARLSQRELVLRDRIRVVTEGVGRLPAIIDENVMDAVVDALENGRQVTLKYRSSSGEEMTHNVTVLGLVAKEGAIYVLGCQGFNDNPRHYPMHRILNAQYSGNSAVQRPEFDIDQYIEAQHQLAHVYREEESPIRLELKVHKDALFHFTERPFNAQQSNPELDDDGWYDIVATVPYTVQLAPFLWSHAGWVKVIGPESIRKRVMDGVRSAAENYGIAKKG